VLYQLARRNCVIPILRKYGKYFKTHRIYRQYLWAVVLPVPAYYLYMNN
jgi:hypothetical protein